MMRIEARLCELENGNATASEIEEFQRLAGEILRNWQPQYPSHVKKRIESCIILAGTKLKGILRRQVGPRGPIPGIVSRVFDLQSLENGG